ncbi:MAG: pitrilysin family protein [Cytophagales bacterium]|nr:pitrilysin family protein [Cytophagales bacterium]
MNTKTDYEVHTFANGIRWVHKEIKHTAMVHCGIMLDIGSRDEKSHEQGLVHFWEHMAFKGTTTKKSHYILHRIDALGGELNAYTTKEKICFHATLLAKYFPRAIQLLVDIVFNSTFPPKEIEKERQVILEEMGMYEDNPEESIMDDFDSLVYANCAMGYNILGTRDSVKSFEQAHFTEFIRQNIDTSRIVLSTVGNIKSSKAHPVAEKYLASVARISNTQHRHIYTNENIKNKIIEKPIQQAHCMIGANAYNIQSNNKVAFYLLTNILGGHAMNTKLNLMLREKHGLVYHVDAHYTPYTDTGLFNIYFGTEKKHVSKCITLIMYELENFKNILLPHKKLKMYKEQLKGQLAVAEENYNGMMLAMAKNTLDLGYMESMKNIFKKIDDIAPEQIMQISREIFSHDKLYRLDYLPNK